MGKQTVLLSLVDEKVAEQHLPIFLQSLRHVGLNTQVLAGAYELTLVLQYIFRLTTPKHLP